VLDERPVGPGIAYVEELIRVLYRILAVAAPRSRGGAGAGAGAGV